MLHLKVLTFSWEYLDKAVTNPGRMSETMTIFTHMYAPENVYLESAYAFLLKPQAISDIEATSTLNLLTLSTIVF